MLLLGLVRAAAVSSGEEERVCHGRERSKGAGETRARRGGLPVMGGVGAWASTGVLLGREGVRIELTEGWQMAGGVACGGWK